MKTKTLKLNTGALLVISHDHLPTLASAVSGKLDGHHVTVFPITERYAGDTHLNEKRKLTGLEIHEFAGPATEGPFKGAPTVNIHRIKRGEAAARIFEWSN